MNIQSSCRVCAVVPTYNNVRTLEEVVRNVLHQINDVIVVDDGCSDGSAEILGDIDGIEVVTHRKNLGKGAALLSGFEQARSLGFTHAISLDSDGQHSTDEIPLFLDAVEAHPDALIIGHRDLSGEGRARKSRLLRKNSNFWVWAETGERVSDTQSGYRVYPLESFSRIRCKKTRYDFEVETIVLAFWSDIPVHSIPVTAKYGPGSESHFRPIVDFLRVTHLNIALIFERIALPKSIRKKMHEKKFHEGSARERWRRFFAAFLIQESITPAAMGGSVGVGVFCGVFPVWGFQTVLALFIAKRFGLSRALAVLASNISIPVFMPLILYCSILIGHFLLFAELDLSLALDDATMASAGTYALAYVLGSSVFACIAGVFAAIFTHVVATFFLRTNESTGA